MDRLRIRSIFDGTSGGLPDCRTDITSEHLVGKRRPVAMAQPDIHIVRDSLSLHSSDLWGAHHRHTFSGYVDSMQSLDLPSSGYLLRTRLSLALSNRAYRIIGLMNISSRN